MAFLFDAVNARPRRRVVVRTRARMDELLEIVGRLVQERPPGGVRQWLSEGYFTSGSAQGQEFELSYRVNNPKNPQAYSVHGLVEDGTDWRVVRLTIRARSPWLGVWMLAGLVALGAYGSIGGGLPWVYSLAIVAFVVGVLALANVLYWPDRVADKVAHHLASELRGSVRERGKWVVPNGA